MAANSLTLLWSASTGSGPITYQPNFRVTGATNWIPYGQAISALTIVIPNLSPSTSYDFEIIASNSAGSVPSAVVSGATSSNNPFPAPGSISGGQNTGSAVPVITGPQNGAASTGVPLALRGITLTDPAAIGATTTVVVKCLSGTVGMTLFGAAVTGSGTNLSTLTDSFSHCQSAAASVIYTPPSTPTTDTISIVCTDQTGAQNTLLIQIQVTITASSVAPNAPTNVVPSAATNTTMRLDWTASTVGNSVIYQPQFKLHTASTYTLSGTTAPAVTAVVTGLTAGLSYDFQIVASNSLGSAASATATASTTSATVAPSAPTNLVVQGVTSSSITYSWTASSTGSAPITYQPQYQFPVGSAAIPFGLPITATSITITGLTAGSAYGLSVVAINGIGQTPAPAVVGTTGRLGIPTDVTGIVARPAQDMLNRFGINTHFGSGLYAAFTPAQAVTALQSIGVTLVRDSENG